MRTKVKLTDTTMDMMMTMSEGNPGAATVLTKLIQKDKMLTILDLDDMNIRGTQVWVAYKDHCGEDIDKLITAVQERDLDMVTKVNEQCLYPEFTEKAVECGASFKR